MRFVFPKNDQQYIWTQHVIEKMRYYNLSEQKIKKVLRSPERIEAGIAPQTIAVMKSVGTSKKPSEVWVMYQLVGSHKKIISAWRYPGRSPLGKKIKIPRDVWEDLYNAGLVSNIRLTLDNHSARLV